MMPHQFYQVNSITRINQLQEYAGPWRVAAGQDDNSGEEDDGCHETLGPPPTIARQHNNQKRPNHCRKNQNASAANCLTRVSQATPREYTQPRESSGARSGPPSPWGTGETKKRIVDALKMSCLTYICTLEISLSTAVQRSTMQQFVRCMPHSKK